MPLEKEVDRHLVGVECNIRKLEGLLSRAIWLKVVEPDEKVNIIFLYWELRLVCSFMHSLHVMSLAFLSIVAKIELVGHWEQLVGRCQMIDFVLFN